MTSEPSGFRLPEGDPVRLSPQQLHACAYFAAEAVRAAGAVTLPYFRTSLAVTDKPTEFYDPVTIADQAAEDVIRARIRETFPEHGIFGEEDGYQPGDSPLTWVIDPIDGTGAFVTGMLHWGVLLALYDGARPIVGALYQPFTDELFWAWPGNSLYQRRSGWVDGRSDEEPIALTARECPDIGAAAFGCTGTHWFPERQRGAFSRVAAAVQNIRWGGDCYLYALIALGQMDLVVEWGLKAYDIQALIPLVENAGGIVTDWRGNSVHQGGGEIAAGDRRVHAQALALLAGGSV